LSNVVADVPEGAGKRLPKGEDFSNLWVKKSAIQFVIAQVFYEEGPSGVKSIHQNQRRFEI